MRTRISPTGFEVEERPEGLYLLGDLDEARQLLGDREHQVTMDGDTYQVAIAYGFGSTLDTGGVAEWGSGSTEEMAWRYALGAAIGSYDDPEKGEA